MGVVLEVDEVHKVELPNGCDRDNTIVVSSTQVDTFTACNRKWNFLWPHKLPTLEADYLTYGKVTHRCLERYQLGEDPYPEGWCAQLAPRDADMIRRCFVDVAIQEGWVERLREGQIVEQPFLREIPSVELPTGKVVRAFVTGIVDVMDLPRATIVDHKTHKNAKWLRKSNRESPLYLGKSTQMMLYARELLLRLEDAGGLPERIRLIHHGFVKDPERPIARRTEAFVTPDEVREHWNKVASVVRAMVYSRTQHTDVHKWWHVPGPDKPAVACSQYMGCPFRLVCCGRWNVLQYVKHVENTERQTSMSNINPFAAQIAQGGAPPVGTPQINGAVPTPATGLATAPAQVFKIVKLGETVPLPDGFDRAGAQAKLDSLGFAAMVWTDGAPKWDAPAAFGFTPTPKAQAPAPAAPPPTPAPAVQKAQQQPAVWYFPGCGACTTNQVPGFDPTGHPCRICDSENAKAGKPQSHHYSYSATGTGSVVYSLKPEFAHLAQGAQAPTTQPVGNGVTAEVQTRVEGAAAPRKRGRKKAAEGAVQAGADLKAAGLGGFELLINCTLTTYEADDVTMLSEVLAEWGAKLAESAKVKSYYEINAFDRRDRIAGAAAMIASELSGVVLVDGSSTDIQSLCDALRPLARRCITGHIR